MKMQIIALAIQEGMKLLGEVIRTRPVKTASVETSTTSVEIEAKSDENEAKTSISEEKKTEGVACIPCVNSHLSTCAGLISDEALRMARRKGIGTEEIRRINKCIDQLNAMEREDLAVDKVADLPDWEKDLALYAQNEGAAIRHSLEHLSTVDELEKAALRISEARDHIGQSWFKQRLERMTPEEKQQTKEKIIKLRETANDSEQSPGE